jgi:hypothetical protein
MYASGFKKSAIAEAVGVTKAAVSNWSKRDRWEERLGAAVQTAERAAQYATQDALAATLAELQARLGQRLVELNLLCGPSQEPRVRLQAIAQWIKLAKELEGKVVKPATPGTLSLIDDYAVDAPTGGGLDSPVAGPSTSDQLQDPREDASSTSPVLFHPVTGHAGIVLRPADCITPTQPPS